MTSALWKIEIRASKWPVEEWVTLTQPSGKLYKYVDKIDAEQALAKLKSVQPHSVMRISPM